MLGAQQLPAQFYQSAGANPPYIRFETLAVERRDTADKGGASHSDDVDFIHITSHGSKDTVTRRVDEYFVYIADQVRQGRFPPPWLEAYKAGYAAWKNTGEVPVVGTPIKNWPMATPAQVKQINAAGIRAVEDLATANETVVARLGMGGRDLCQRAKDFVQARKDTGPLVAEASALRSENAGLKVQLGTLEQLVRDLGSRIDVQDTAIKNSQYSGAPVPSLEDRLAQAKESASRTEISDAEAVDDVLDESLGTKL